jgi:uncharacterized protein YjaG (DUF416 family)
MKTSSVILGLGFSIITAACFAQANAATHKVKSCKGQERCVKVTNLGKETVNVRVSTQSGKTMAYLRLEKNQTGYVYKK